MNYAQNRIVGHPGSHYSNWDACPRGHEFFQPIVIRKTLEHLIPNRHDAATGLGISQEAGVLRRFERQGAQRTHRSIAERAKEERHFDGNRQCAHLIRCPAISIVAHSFATRRGYMPAASAEHARIFSQEIDDEPARRENDSERLHDGTENVPPDTGPAQKEA